MRYIATAFVLVLAACATETPKLSDAVGAAALGSGGSEAATEKSDVAILPTLAQTVSGGQKTQHSKVETSRDSTASLTGQGGQMAFAFGLTMDSAEALNAIVKEDYLASFYKADLERLAAAETRDQAAIDATAAKLEARLDKLTAAHTTNAGTVLGNLTHLYVTNISGNYQSGTEPKPTNEHDAAIAPHYVGVVKANQGAKPKEEEDE